MSHGLIYICIIKLFPVIWFSYKCFCHITLHYIWKLLFKNDNWSNSLRVINEVKILFIKKYKNLKNVIHGLQKYLIVFGFYLLFVCYPWTFINLFIFHYLGGPPNDRSGDFIVQEDTIFVSGMSSNTSEADIEQHFGSIGIIKVMISLT